MSQTTKNTATANAGQNSASDTFTRAYIECALWSSVDDDGTPLDRDYSANASAGTIAQSL